MSWSHFHPITRITIVVAIVLVAVLFTGWERVGEALANMSPAGTFEDRCESLPSGGAKVTIESWNVSENQTLPFATLTRISEGPSPAHRTIGLTQANFGHRSSIEVRGLEDRAGYRACVRPRVQVDLYVRQLTVYIAREYAGDPCQARSIREHEQRHVDVYTGYARESAAGLHARLAAIVGTGPHFATSVGEAQRGLDRKVAETLESFMRESERTLATRQAHVDTPEEYARVGTACLASAK